MEGHTISVPPAAKPARASVQLSPPTPNRFGSSMSRNEAQTCRELIEPALAKAEWEWDPQVVIGPGRVNLTGESMYDPSQQIVADYVLRLWRMPLAVLEAKAEGHAAADGIQQGSRYAKRLGLRFSISSNGREYILTDNESGDYETFDSPPLPATSCTAWAGTSSGRTGGRSSRLRGMRTRSLGRKSGPTRRWPSSRPCIASARTRSGCSC